MAATNNTRTGPESRRAVAAKVKAILAMRPTDHDVKHLRAILGAVKVRTLVEVSEVFGVAANTVKQGWRGGGMPGKNGSYDVAAILHWLLARDAALAAKRTTTDDSTAELERQKLALQIDRLARLEEMALGKLIDRDSVATAIKTAGAVLSERLMRVPSQVEPILPANIAPATVEAIERLIRRELTAFAETSARDILKEWAHE